jgi:hypothetical protein
MYAGVCGFDPESLEACNAIDGEQYKDGRSEGIPARSTGHDIPPGYLWVGEAELPYQNHFMT